MSEEVRVAVLEQKIEDVKVIIIRIDDVIEKLSEVNSNVSKILAVHEEKISKQEQTDNILFAKIDKLRDKVDIDYDRVVSRVQVIEKRVWMAIGALACLTFLLRIPAALESFRTLTSSMQSSIMEYRNFKA